MKIDIYMAEICGSYHQLRENLEKAVRSLDIEPEVSFRTVYYDEAVNRNIKGSPSIWIDGKDAFESDLPPGIL